MLNKDVKSYKILLVEDNPGDALLVKEYLDETILRPNLSIQNTFEKAKEILTAQEFDIVLLDLSLPDKNGIDLINSILAISNSSPIIVLTGYSDINFSIKSLSYGIADYLIKEDLNPFTLYKSIAYNIERNKILVNLKESEKRYSNLFHLSPLPMWLFDIHTLKILDVNLAAINHYGYSDEEFRSFTIKELRPDSELHKLDNYIHELKQNDNFECKGTWIHRKKNGELIQVDISSKSVQYEGREARLILANDITERLNQIQRLELQNKAFKEISWIQSHLVRAPLARIMGLVEVLKEDDINEMDKKTFLEFLKISATELDSIIYEIVKKSHDVNKNFDEV